MSLNTKGIPDLYLKGQHILSVRSGKFSRNIPPVWNQEEEDKRVKGLMEQHPTQNQHLLAGDSIGYDPKDSNSLSGLTPSEVTEGDIYPTPESLPISVSNINGLIDEFISCQISVQPKEPIQEN